MLKLVLITASLAVLAFGRPQAPAAPPSAPAAASPPSASHAPAQNVTYIKDERTPLDGMGSYKYDIELSDGTKFTQEGNTEPPAAGENETSIVIKGSYSYTSPDGTPVNVMYIANKDGYQPTGDVIPKASPVPGAPASPPGSSPPAAGAPPASNSSAAAAASASAPAAPPLPPSAGSNAPVSHPF